MGIVGGVRWIHIRLCVPLNTATEESYSSAGQRLIDTK